MGGSVATSNKMIDLECTNSVQRIITSENKHTRWQHHGRFVGAQLK